MPCQYVDMSSDAFGMKEQTTTFWSTSACIKHLSGVTRHKETITNIAVPSNRPTKEHSYRKPVVRLEYLFRNERLTNAYRTNLDHEKSPLEVLCCLPQILKKCGASLLRGAV